MPDAPLIALDRPAQELVERELAPGERVVWARRPIPRWFTAASLGPTLVAIPFTAFSIFWTVMATGMTSGSFGGRAPTHPPPAAVQWFFPLWGLMFVVAGLVMLATPLRARSALKRSVYVITDRRALVLRRSAFGSTSSQSYGPAALAHLDRRERRDGSGDLILETLVRRTNRNGTSTTRRGFMSVPDVRGVEATLRATLLDGRVSDAR